MAGIAGLCCGRNIVERGRRLERETERESEGERERERENVF